MCLVPVHNDNIFLDRDDRNESEFLASILILKSATMLNSIVSQHSHIGVVGSPRNL